MILCHSEDVLLRSVSKLALRKHRFIFAPYLFVEWRSYRSLSLRSSLYFSLSASPLIEPQYLGYGMECSKFMKGPFPRSRTRKSETFRSQYIETKELKLFVNTWNLGGELPPDDLNIKDLLDTYYPADIYVIGIVSKQMLGVFLIIWVRKSLRKQIKNVHVSNCWCWCYGLHRQQGVNISKHVHI